jgi:hypothetical protein
MVAKSPSESTVGNSSIDSRYGATWNHAWSSRFSSVLSYSNLKTEYQGLVAAQTDKTDTVGLKLNYQWTRNVKIGAGYDWTDKTSNNPTMEYKRNIYSVFLNAAI